MPSELRPCDDFQEQGFASRVKCLEKRLAETERRVTFWESEAKRFAAGWRRTQTRLAEAEAILRGARSERDDYQIALEAAERERDGAALESDERAEKWVDAEARRAALEKALETWERITSEPDCPCGTCAAVVRVRREVLSLLAADT